MIMKLMQNNINPNHVAQLSGHKNIKSLDYYSKNSDAQQQKMSNLISGALPQVMSLTLLLYLKRIQPRFLLHLVPYLEYKFPGMV